MNIVGYIYNECIIVCPDCVTDKILERDDCHPVYDFEEIGDWSCDRCLELITDN